MVIHRPIAGNWREIAGVMLPVEEILSATVAGEAARPQITSALAEALLMDHSTLVNISRWLGTGEARPLAQGPDLLRAVLVFARAAHSGKAPPILIKRLSEVEATQPEAERDKLARLLLLGPEAISGGNSQEIVSLPSGPALTPEKRLEAAYKARDWLAARLAVSELRTYAYGETLIQRVAETLAACGEFREALVWADRSIDPARRVKLDHVRARALVGLGDVDSALNVLEAASRAGRPAHMTALAAVCVRLERAYGRLPFVLSMNLSNSVTLSSVIPILRDIETDPVLGRKALLAYLRKASQQARLTGASCTIISQLRFRFASSGWPTASEARWARLLAHNAGRPRWPLENVTHALMEQGRPRLALQTIKHIGLDGVSHGLRCALALQLAQQGDWHSCHFLTGGLVEIPGPLAAFISGFEPVLRARAGKENPHAVLEFVYDSLNHHVGAADLIAPARKTERLLHIGTTFAVGGTERQLQTVIRGLAARHPDLHQTVVLARRGMAGEFERDLAGLHSRLTFLTPDGLDRELPSTPPGFEGIEPDELGRKAVRWARIHRLAALIRESRATSVMIWRLDAAALMAARIAGAKSIVVRAGSLPPAFRPWHTEAQLAAAGAFQAATQALSSHAGLRLVANSQASLDGFRVAMNWPEDRSAVVYNSLELSRFRPSGGKRDGREVPGIPGDRIVVGGIFRLSPEKRPFLWLDVAREIVKRRSDLNLHFMLVGDGPLFHRLGEIISNDPLLRERVQMAGKIEQEIEHYYRSFDVLLHTSSIEGLPNVLIEAQAAYCPVVTVDAGGCREAIVPGKTGLVSSADDYGSIADGLESVLSNLAFFHSSDAAAACETLLNTRFSPDINLKQLEVLLGL